MRYKFRHRIEKAAQPDMVNIVSSIDHAGKKYSTEQIVAATADAEETAMQKAENYFIAEIMV